ncbi:hypothetical protein Kpol_1006p4 [Vanderwaltozyma polyspora DSM 70294]|uniref:Uncharacterized protein n=1 Tax=Vanderwaltozyma polyspora (strain ATCC 22028 / DSM 70294 / BCRC 21397 / CBS 2163 / NBRC 10782 / NRRL Y-8283 / UCD 57-17) TaxID=436907 RepID=A7TQ40_VANPO|nr:uncharacterized protein Kpol_1006p4 [Vanderwaltozyma polyspora DSM 70294]EDO15608.1 hypothetical protein Kpol_1006p4 [Vanderwaltozyma polyspora DSM 70294]
MQALVQTQPLQSTPVSLQQVPPNVKNIDPIVQSTADTWLSIASLAETLNDTTTLIRAYHSVLAHDPLSVTALVSLANFYRSTDAFDKAVHYYEKAVALDSTLAEVWSLLGHSYLMLDELQKAYNAYQQALYHLADPNVPRLWHGIGILYDRYGSLEYAEEAFAKVLELDPKFDKANEIYFRLGIIYKHQGKFNQALDCFNYILTNPPQPLKQWDIWFQIGNVLENIGVWENAKIAYENVLLQNDRHAKVLQQLGCLYAMNNNLNFYNPEKALNYLLRSLEVDSEDSTTWYHLGRIHMIRSDYNAAYEAFQQAVNRDARNPIFWCSIGVLYYQIYQYRDALDAYTRAIRLNPYISEVWYDLGTLYETCNNQLTDALDAYKQAARLEPDNTHIRERLDALTNQLSTQQGNINQKIEYQKKNENIPLMLQPTLQPDLLNPLNMGQNYNKVHLNPTILPNQALHPIGPQPPSLIPPILNHEKSLPQKRPFENNINKLVSAAVSNSKSSNKSTPQSGQQKQKRAKTKKSVNNSKSQITKNADNPSSKILSKSINIATQSSKSNGKETKNKSVNIKEKNSAKGSSKKSKSSEKTKSDYQKINNKSNSNKNVTVSDKKVTNVAEKIEKEDNKMAKIENLSKIEIKNTNECVNKPVLLPIQNLALEPDRGINIVNTKSVANSSIPRSGIDNLINATKYTAENHDPMAVKIQLPRLKEITGHIGPTIPNKTNMHENSHDLN